jgi:hypothetical protein
MKHGHSWVNGKASLTYGVWRTMRTRCTNPNHPTYARYGSRGIKVCERWNKFANFLADMGVKPDGLSLDRIDNDGDYKFENCHWATQAEQNRNTRSNISVTIDGETKLLLDWAVIYQIKYQTAYRRIHKYGLTPYEALTRPIGRYTRKPKEPANDSHKL